MSLGWEPSRQYSYQVLHYLGASTIVLGTPYTGLDAWWGVLGILLFAVGKEFWADTAALRPLPLAGWLENDSLAGSVLDFSFYTAGALLARLAVTHFWWGLALGVLVLLGMVLFDWVGQWASEFD